MTPQLKTRVRVRSYELDSFGHVNNAVFLNYLELARSEFLLQNGLSFNDFHKWRVYSYVTEIKIQYRSPALYNDLLEISGEIIRWTRTSFTMAKQIHNVETGKLVASAEVRLAFVNEKGRPTAIPEAFRAQFGMNTPEKK